MKIVKINGINPLNNIKAPERVSRTNEYSKKTAQDKVAVSQNAQVFQNLLQKAKELPDLREEKINSITGSIERGEFNLDPEGLAAWILNIRGR